MNNKSLVDFSDKELVEYIRSQKGHQAASSAGSEQTANRDAAKAVLDIRLAKATENLNLKLLWFTIVIAVLTFVVTIASILILYKHE